VSGSLRPGPSRYPLPGGDRRAVKPLRVRARDRESRLGHASRSGGGIPEVVNGPAAGQKSASTSPPLALDRTRWWAPTAGRGVQRSPAEERLALAHTRANRSR